MDDKHLIKSFYQIGQSLQELLIGAYKIPEVQKRFISLRENTSLQNPWFSKENFNYAVRNIFNDLQSDQWSELFQTFKRPVNNRNKIAVILAGNKPAYGFPEMLCILLSGSVFIGKQTANDNEILEFIASLIKEEIPEFSDKIHFEGSSLKGFDAVIANDYKIDPAYFLKYFSNYPHLLHPRKFTAAMITGNETDEALKNLGKDVFTYFGRSIYNVSRLLVPVNYDFHPLLQQCEEYNYLTSSSRYMNQYEYSKSVYLLNQIPHYDSGFVLLRESEDHHTPVGCVHYSVYQDDNEKSQYVNTWKRDIESLVVINQHSELYCPPGMATQKKLIERSRIPQIIDFLNNL